MPSDPPWRDPFPRETVVQVMEACHVSMSQAIQAVVSLQGPARSLLQSLLDLERTLDDAACASWLHTHRRLPGSRRTARLRKKRRDLVLRAWWQENSR